jgi:hypothetical protein
LSVCFARSSVTTPGRSRVLGPLEPLCISADRRCETPGNPLELHQSPIHPPCADRSASDGA